MAELFEARKIEEAAVALHGVDEAEDGVEAFLVGGIALPRDDLARQRFHHVARLGNEVCQQIVHATRPLLAGGYGAGWLSGG